MRRKKVTIQLLAVLGIVLISAFTWIGYNYDTWLTWCMDKKNITALCFFVIGALYVVVIVLRIMYVKLESTKNYYRDQSERYYEEIDSARRDNYSLREKNENLSIELRILKKDFPYKKKK